MSVLHSDIGLLTELQFVMISWNLISSIPASICLLSKLEILSLEVNLITSLPDCISTLTKITDLFIDYNQIESIPDCSQMIHMKQFDCSENKIQTLPSNMFINMKQIEYIVVYNNLIHSEIPILAGLTKLRAVLLNENSFYGTLDTHSFDSMPDLYYFDIHSNLIEGTLPTFIDSQNLEFIDIRSNLFSGSIPSSWQYLQALETFLGDQNQIESPIATLGSLNALIDLSLSHNILACNIGDGVNDGDAGLFISNVIGLSLLRVDLSFNLLAGLWRDTYSYENIESLNVAHNEIEQFPFNFMQLAESIQILDISFNHLQGSFPDIIDGVEPLRTLASIDVRGNPKFHGPDQQLPEWAIIRTDQYVKSLDQPFLCPQLGSRNLPTMSLLVDPSYYSYSTCICDRGTFGGPPDCYIIPESQDINAVEYPVFSHLNRTFTDSWYGDQRMTSGLSTSWVINEQSNNAGTLSHNAATSSNNAATTSTFVSSSLPAVYSTVTSTPAKLSIPASNTATSFHTAATSSSPVLMINVTFYVNLDLFTSFTDILEIYEGNEKNILLLVAIS
jgi:Leucine-rich repeat (LRR) protein